MFKVKCELTGFMGDEEHFGCHFNYKIGDAFYYDGTTFSGKICIGLFGQMVPIIHGLFLLGNKYSGNIMYAYRGPDVRDPSMAKYDGLGFRPLKEPSEDAPERLRKFFMPPIPTRRAKKVPLVCADARTSCRFICEAVDLSDSPFCQPFYRREIAILEKIEAEPGIKTDQILDKFSEFEREGITPPLTPVLLEIMLDALVDMNYVEVRDGTAYATGKEPPSRPKFGQQKD